MWEVVEQVEDLSGLRERGVEVKRNIWKMRSDLLFSLKYREVEDSQGVEDGKLNPLQGLGTPSGEASNCSTRCCSPLLLRRYLF